MSLANRSTERLLRATLLGLVVAMAAGCATPGAKTAGQRLDPWENWNRKVFSFNEKLDEQILRPVATVYSKVVPRMVRVGIDNFFNNARDAWSAVNNVLQAKPGPAAHDLIRVGTNTFFGLGGLVDFASEMGLEHSYEDFGQTLGRWGIGAGAYLMLPLLGPSTVRDTAALPLDRSVSPAVVINNGGAVAGLTTLQLINFRANLLQAGDVVDDIALDKYTFIRDAYLQRRRSLVLDGDDAEGEDTYAPPGDQSTPAPARPAR